jgi:hypothetical protein
MSTLVCIHLFFAQFTQTSSPTLAEWYRCIIALPSNNTIVSLLFVSSIFITLAVSVHFIGLYIKAVIINPMQNKIRPATNN